MYSPRSYKASDFGSFSNKAREFPDSMSSRKVPSQIFDDRSKSYTQLSNFYMPHLQRIYQQNKTKIPTLKPPEQLFFNSKLLEMRQNQMKKRIDIVQKDNEAKQHKIRQLSSKIVNLTEKLKYYQPGIVNEIDVPFNGFTEVEKDLKRLEKLFKTKNQQTLFSLKIKAMSLLQQYSVDRTQIEGVRQLQNQNSLVEFILNHLKGKGRQIRFQSQSINQQSQRQRIIQSKLEQQIKFLSQSNQMIRNSERRLKQKYEQIKKQWSSSNQKLIYKQKQNEQMDIEIFRLKKLLDEKQRLLVQYNSKVHNKAVVVDGLKNQYENQIQDLRVLLNDYITKINDLKQELEWKQGQLQQVRIDLTMKTHEHDKVQRQYIRWKDRYQSYQKDNTTKIDDTSKFLDITKMLQQQNANLKQQIMNMQFSQPCTPNAETFDIKGHTRIIQKLKNQVINKTQQVQRLNQRIDQLQSQKRMKQMQTQDSSLIIERKYDKLMKDMQLSYKNNKNKLNDEWQRIYNDTKDKYENDLKDYSLHINNLESELAKARRFEAVHKRQQYGAFNYRSTNNQSQI